MGRKFQIGEDGSIFSIGGDGTIHRIGKIDASGNIEGKKTGQSNGTLVFFFVLFVLISIGLGIALISTSNDLNGRISYYRSIYEDANSANDTLRIQVSNLESTNRSLVEENRSLNSRDMTYVTQATTQTCQVISDKAFFYYWAGGYHTTNYSYDMGTTAQVYAIKDGYALTMFGWLRMSDIKIL